VSEDKPQRLKITEAFQPLAPSDAKCTIVSETVKQLRVDLWLDADPNLTITDVAWKLNEMGYRTSMGTVINVNNVSAALRRNWGLKYAQREYVPHRVTLRAKWSKAVIESEFRVRIEPADDPYAKVSEEIAKPQVETKPRQPSAPRALEAPYGEKTPPKPLEINKTLTPEEAEAHWAQEREKLGITTKNKSHDEFLNDLKKHAESTTEEVKSKPLTLDRRMLRIKVVSFREPEIKMISELHSSWKVLIPTADYRLNRRGTGSMSTAHKYTLVNEPKIQGACYVDVSLRKYVLIPKDLILSNPEYLTESTRPFVWVLSVRRMLEDHPDRLALIDIPVEGKDYVPDDPVAKDVLKKFRGES
jgi:hypothetical protein